MIPATSHVYRRTAAGDANDSLSALAALIPPGSRVLDLGMGAGSLGQRLRAGGEAPPHCLHGLSLNPEEAALASAYYDAVHVADLDHTPLHTLPLLGAYDYIVCADVLEHLKHPEQVLSQCEGLLAPGGRLLLSIPNVAYTGLIAELLAGHFQYRPEGLLDRTHLRFFTRASLAEWLLQQGWAAALHQRIHKPVHESEFHIAFDALPPAISQYLLAIPEGDTYQFIVQAWPQAMPAPKGQWTPLQETSASPLLQTPWFTSQLYLATPAGFDEARKQVAGAPMGNDAQWLYFSIPPQPDGYTQIRWDPSDRPGLMRIWELELQDAHGAILWQWSATHHSLAYMGHWGLGHVMPIAQPGELLLAITGDDPQLTLPLLPHMLATLAAHGGALRVRTGWPMSADGMALLQHCRLAADAKPQVSETEHLQLAQALQESRQELLRTQQTLKAKQAYLESIERSTVFKLTRPLVALKMHLQQRRHSQESTRPAAVNTRTLPKHPVDVIVPVYGGLADTQRCLRSVLNSACQQPMRLIVVNDCSPEPAITQWLRELQAAHPAIVLLENPENLGFVGSVNRGMSHSTTHDVVLLNSDAEVANDWLDRLAASCYQSDRTGTATPFSNNATICSYPRFCEVNALPPGLSVAALDQLCATYLSGQVVPIPTAHGFCMYIKRACLAQVGLFDVENFGKGYGEENDFCMRARQHGWDHVHAQSVFVGHAGGVSFGASKHEREQAAGRTMRRLHPEYDSLVHHFITQDPIRPARLLLDLARLCHGTTPTVLHVCHNRGGGTLQFIREQAQRTPTAQHLLLTPAPGGAELSWVDANEHMRLAFECPRELDDLVACLQAMRVQRLHLHHWLGFGSWVHQLPAALEAPYNAWVHDFYAVCPQISFTNETDRYCGELGEADCTRCLSINPAPGGVGIVQWRTLNGQWLRGAQQVTAPSHDTALRLQRYIPNLHVHVQPHEALQPAPLCLRPLQPGQTLKVAVLGALGKIKGADTVEAVARLSKTQQAGIEFHLLGYPYRNLSRKPRTTLTVHGPYETGELDDLLDDLDPHLVWFPAQCPETYSYTLSACLRKGLPVVVTNLGALPERVAGRPWSWVCDWQLSPAQWLATLQRIRDQHLLSLLPPIPPEPRIAPGTQASDTAPRQEAVNLEAPAPALVPLSQEALKGLANLLLPRQDALKNNHGGSRVLQMLVWLRNRRLLAPVAKAVPGAVQRRIKNWLLR